jgi:hypothetical protein
VDDAIDPITTVDLVRLEIEAELLAHHTSEEAADQWVTRMMAAIVAPSCRASIASRRACFELGLVSRGEPAVVFALPG